MTQTEPRFENAEPIMLAGIDRVYTMKTMGEIPAQWQDFGEKHFGKVPGQVGDVGYGVSTFMFDGGDSFRYMTGVEVSDFSNIPDDFTGIRLPAQKYAVFAHAGHVSQIPATIDYIFNKWLPESGQDPAYSPTFFERYAEDFDPAVAIGGVEIWIPVKD